MTQKYQTLRKQLTALNERKSGLGARMSQAAIELKDAGVPPADLLLEQLSLYRKEFAELRAQAKDLAKSLPKLTMAPQIASLKDLDTILEQLEKSESSSVGDRDRALQILDRVGAIAHSDEPNFPPLQDAKAKARELRRLIAQSSVDALPQPVQALSSGDHPFAGLLTLIDPPADLSDDRWGVLVEVVTRAFSKSLTVAAARGKLSVDTTVPSVSTVAHQTATPTPTPAAPPAPSASSEQNFPEVLIISDEETARSSDPSDASVLNPPSTPVNSPDVIILPSYEQPPTQPAKPVEPLVFGSVPLSAQKNVSQTSDRPTSHGASLGLKVLVHIERLGDRLFKQDEFAGTRGKALRVEGLAINIDPPISGLSLEYMAHIEGVGDTPWTAEGEFLGDRGQGKRLEGFAIRLTGENANNYNVFYVAHIQNIGDSSVCFNGDYCGSRGKGLRIEGIKVWLQKRA